MAQTYLDFVIEIGTGDGITYPVAVRSPGAGEARTSNPFPLQTLNWKTSCSKSRMRSCAAVVNGAPF